MVSPEGAGGLRAVAMYDGVGFALMQSLRLVLSWLACRESRSDALRVYLRARTPMVS